MTSSCEQTSSQLHNRTQRFREQQHRRNGQPGPQRFPYTSSKNLRADFKYFQVYMYTHVQTARESSDFNMDLRSINNELKQLYEYILCRNVWYFQG